MRSYIIIAVLSGMVMFTGCDAFRRLAGRPTSEEIESRRAAIEAVRNAEHQARLDSMRQVEKKMADSLAVMDSLKKMKEITVLNSSTMGILDTSVLTHKYYIIIGSFMDKGNAGYLRKKAESSGYESVLINFRNGYTAVGVSPQDNIVSAYEALKKVSDEPFSPDGVWILVN